MSSINGYSQPLDDFSESDVFELDALLFKSQHHSTAPITIPTASSNPTIVKTITAASHSPPFHKIPVPITPFHSAPVPIAISSTPPVSSALNSNRNSIATSRLYPKAIPTSTTAILHRIEESKSNIHQVKNNVNAKDVLDGLPFPLTVFDVNGEPPISHSTSITFIPPPVTSREQPRQTIVPKSILGTSYSYEEYLAKNGKDED